MDKNAKKTNAQKPMRQYVMTFESHYQKQFDAAKQSLNEDFNFSTEDVASKFKVDNAEELTTALNKAGVPIEEFKKAADEAAKKFNADTLYIGGATATSSGKKGRRVAVVVKDGKGTVRTKKKDK